MAREVLCTGTVISNAIVFGAIVFGAAMLVQFRPELEQHRHRHRPGRRRHPRSMDEKKRQLPLPTFGAVHRGPRGVKRVVPLE